MRVFFDTSVLVPALADQLANHEAALDALLRHTEGSHQGYCSTHALAECYATWTALPLPRRILPNEARRLIEESVLGRLAAVPLTPGDYANALRRTSDHGRRVGSGTDPDRHAGPNLRHFGLDVSRALLRGTGSSRSA